MVKKFTTDCDFGGQKVPVTLYVGTPSLEAPHPLHFQSKWLSGRGGVIPPDVMNSFAKLKEIADKNRVPFENLCEYVINEIKSSNSLKTDARQASALSKPESKNQ